MYVLLLNRSEQRMKWDCYPGPVEVGGEKFVLTHKYRGMREVRERGSCEGKEILKLKVVSLHSWFERIGYIN